MTILYVTTVINTSLFHLLLLIWFLVYLDEEGKNMAFQEHIDILMQGVEAWNSWREKEPYWRPDLSGINLYLRDPYATENMIYRENNLYNFILKGMDLHGINFKEVNLRNANLERVILRKADLEGADFTKAELRQARLEGATFFRSKCCEARIIDAKLDQTRILYSDFSGAVLAHASIQCAELDGVDLRGANLNWTNLQESQLTHVDFRGAVLIETNLDKTIIDSCSVYGVSAWKLRMEGAKQSNLYMKSTDPDEPSIAVDDIEVAQFIYLLLNNQKIRRVIDTITSKVVLILGRFTSERKQVLDALREELRQDNLLPVVFDFPPSKNQDLTETISTLAHMSRFIIVDLTDPSSAPHEMATIAPQCIRPIKPIITNQPMVVNGQEVERYEYAMFKDLQRRYHWVLETYRYQDIPHLLASLREQIITPAEQKAQELESR